MSHPNSRNLDTPLLIKHFLSVALNQDDVPNDLIMKIKSGEAELKNIDNTPSTLTSTDHRLSPYITKNERWSLRKQIVKELIEQVREGDDDEISLGKGGAIPNSELKKDKKAIIVIGLPASGKSGIANRLSDKFGAVILDSDFAKRKFPEFENNPAGASLVHEESDELIFSYTKDDKPSNFKTLFEICCQESYNIVIPKIGHNSNSINLLAKKLKENFGYTVDLVLVSLDKKKATIRAMNRYINTGRYVPLSLIFDGYGNEPILTFYRLKDKMYEDKIFIDTFGKISTDVEKDQNPKVLYSSENSPVIEIYNNNKN